MERRIHRYWNETRSNASDETVEMRTEYSVEQNYTVE